MLNHLMFCNICLVIGYFILIMQFYFILSTYNYHRKVIHHKGQNNIETIFSLSWLWSFWTKIKVHMWGPFNLMDSKESDFLWYPRYIYIYTHHWHSSVYTLKLNKFIAKCLHINRWTRYSSEYVMCHDLTAFTKSLLLLNVCTSTVAPSRRSGNH